MRVAIINIIYGNGSTGKHVQSLQNFLKNNCFDVKSFCAIIPNDCHDPDVIQIGNRFERILHHLLACISGLTGCFSNIGTTILLYKLQQYKPDIVIIYNIHGYYVNEFRLLRFIKKKDIPFIYSMPDEYAFTGKCTYTFGCTKYQYLCSKCPNLRVPPKSYLIDNSSIIQKMKSRTYNGMDKSVFISAEYIVKTARTSYLLKSMKFDIIDSAVDIENIYYPRNAEMLRKKYEIDNNCIVALCVAPFLDKRKGVKYFLECARIMLNENIIFINVGYNGQGERLPSNFKPVEYLSNQDELATYYSMADVFVCTSIADAMPNSCIESLGCGTPICGFNISGIPYIADEMTGKFVDAGNVEELSRVILEYGKKTDITVNRCHDYAASRYSMKTSMNKYLSIIYSMLKNTDDTKLETINDGK